MVHGLANKVPCAGLYIKAHQRLGIKPLSLPQCTNVLVAKCRRMPVVPHMVAVLVGTLYIHMPGVPVAVHWNRLRAPVRPDAEFRVAEPVRALVLAQGIKVRKESKLASKFFVIIKSTP